MSNRNLPTQSKRKFGVLRGEMSMDVTPCKKLGYDTKKNNKAVLSHRFNLFLKCLTSLTSSNMSKKHLNLS